MSLFILNRIKTTWFILFLGWICVGSSLSSYAQSPIISANAPGNYERAQVLSGAGRAFLNATNRYKDGERSCSSLLQFKVPTKTGTVRANGSNYFPEYNEVWLGLYPAPSYYPRTMQVTYASIRRYFSDLGLHGCGITLPAIRIYNPGVLYVVDFAYNINSFTDINHAQAVLFTDMAGYSYNSRSASGFTYEYTMTDGTHKTSSSLSTAEHRRGLWHLINWREMATIFRIRGCEGETVELKVQNGNYDSYTWFYGNQRLNETTATIEAEKPGLYSVQATKDGVITTSQEVYVEFKATTKYCSPAPQENIQSCVLNKPQPQITVENETPDDTKVVKTISESGRRVLEAVNQLLRGDATNGGRYDHAISTGVLLPTATGVASGCTTKDEVPIAVGWKYDETQIRLFWASHPNEVSYYGVPPAAYPDYYETYTNPNCRNHLYQLNLLNGTEDFNIHDIASIDLSETWLTEEDDGFEIVSGRPTGLPLIFHLKDGRSVKKSMNWFVNGYGVDNPYITWKETSTIPRYRGCLGQSMTLTADAGYARYEWSDGSTGQSISISKSGYYTVKVTTSEGCHNTSNPIYVSFDRPPSACLSCATSTLVAPTITSSDGTQTTTQEVKVMSTAGKQILDGILGALHQDTDYGYVCSTYERDTYPNSLSTFAPSHTSLIQVDKHTGIPCPQNFVSNTVPLGIVWHWGDNSDACQLLWVDNVGSHYQFYNACPPQNATDFMQTSELGSCENHDYRLLLAGGHNGLRMADIGYIDAASAIITPENPDYDKDGIPNGFPLTYYMKDGQVLTKEAHVGVYTGNGDTRYIIWKEPIQIPKWEKPCGEGLTLRVPDTYHAYQWSTGETTPEITVTTSGVYTLRVYDIDGCWKDAQPIYVSFEGDDCEIPLNFTIIHQDRDTPGSASARVEPENGYTYSWEDKDGNIVSDSHELTDLSAGEEYTLVVRQHSGNISYMRAVRVGYHTGWTELNNGLALGSSSGGCIQPEIQEAITEEATAITTNEIAIGQNAWMQWTVEENPEEHTYYLGLGAVGTSGASAMNYAMKNDKGNLVIYEDGKPLSLELGQIKAGTLLTIAYFPIINQVVYLRNTEIIHSTELITPLAYMLQGMLAIPEATEAYQLPCVGFSTQAYDEIQPHYYWDFNLCDGNYPNAAPERNAEARGNMPIDANLNHVRSIPGYTHAGAELSGCLIQNESGEWEGSYINIASLFALSDAIETWTLEARIRPGIVGTETVTILHREGDFTFSLSPTTPNGDTWTPHLDFTAYNLDATPPEASQNQDIEMNPELTLQPYEWIQVTLVFKKGNLKMYLGGTKVIDMETGGKFFRIGRLYNLSPILIGTDADIYSDSFDENTVLAPMMIDELKIYHRAMEEAQVIHTALNTSLYKPYACALTDPTIRLPLCADNGKIEFSSEGLIPNEELSHAVWASEEDIHQLSSHDGNKVTGVSAGGLDIYDKIETDLFTDVSALPDLFKFSQGHREYAYEFLYTPSWNMSVTGDATAKENTGILQVDESEINDGVYLDGPVHTYNELPAGQDGKFYVVIGNDKERLHHPLFPNYYYDKADYIIGFSSPSIMPQTGDLHKFQKIIPFFLHGFHVKNGQLHIYEQGELLNYCGYGMVYPGDVLAIERNVLAEGNLEIIYTLNGKELTRTTSQIEETEDDESTNPCTTAHANEAWRLYATLGGGRTGSIGVSFGAPTTNIITCATQKLEEVLATSAITFSPDIRQKAAGKGTPYAQALRGHMWKVDGSYTYVEERSQTVSETQVVNETQVQPHLMKDGVFPFRMFRWEFHGQENAPQWKRVAETTRYNPSGNATESRSIYGNYGAVLYGYPPQLPIASASNAAFHEIGYTSFEEELVPYQAGNFDILNENATIQGERNYALFRGQGTYVRTPGNLSGEVKDVWIKAYCYTSEGIQLIPETSYRVLHYLWDAVTDSTTICLETAPCSGTWKGTLWIKQEGTVQGNTEISQSSDQAHTGKYSLKINPETTVRLTQRRISTEPHQKYVVSGWVYALSETDQYNPPLSYLEQVSITCHWLPDSQTKTIPPLYPTGQLINGWQRIEGIVEVPAAYERASGTFELQLQNQFDHAIYIDDLRFFPADGNMTSHVYDLQTYRLTESLDANNYFVRYYYDSEGSLFLTERETAEGIYTVSESQRHIKEKEKK